MKTKTEKTLTTTAEKTPTTETTDALKQHVHESVGLLKTLRDEILVEVHLAGMEAKEQWEKLEARFNNVEQLVRNGSNSAKQAVDDAIESFKSFKNSLTMKSENQDAAKPVA